MFGKKFGEMRKNVLGIVVGGLFLSALAEEVELRQIDYLHNCD